MPRSPSPTPDYMELGALVERWARERKDRTLDELVNWIMVRSQRYPGLIVNEARFWSPPGKWGETIPSAIDRGWPRKALIDLAILAKVCADESVAGPSFLPRMARLEIDDALKQALLPLPPEGPSGPWTRQQIVDLATAKDIRDSKGRPLTIRFKAIDRFMHSHVPCETRARVGRPKSRPEATRSRARRPAPNALVKKSTRKIPR